MRRLLFLLCFILIYPLYAYKILFDYTKDETAGNADWVIDRDFPLPRPLNPQNENDWDGAISAFGVAIVNQLGDTVFTLHNYPITYHNPHNPYDLSNFDVFVIPEPQNPFTTSEKDAIKRFVENGGGLFIISDHNNSDRNHSGWDSPRVLNDLGSGELFGMHFNITNESNNYFTYTSHNINTFAPITDGPFGTVYALAFHGGTSITLRQDLNPHVRGIVFKNQDNTGCMFAISTYGRGRVAGLGDSSPLDDGTGDPHDRLYDGWNETGGSHISLFLNTIAWLEGRGENSQELAFSMDGIIDSTASLIMSNSNLYLYASSSDSAVYVGLKFKESGRIYAILSGRPDHDVPVPWGREGYIKNFSFYVVYSGATGEVSVRDSLGLPFMGNVQKASSDSVLEFVFSRDYLRGDTFYLFAGIFSPLTYSMEYTLPAGENGEFSYVPVYLEVGGEEGVKPPIISQGFTEPVSFYAEEPFSIYTYVFDNTQSPSVQLVYRVGEGPWSTVYPDSMSGGRYYFGFSGIPSTAPMTYYFRAQDGEGHIDSTILYKLSIVDNPYRVYFEEDTLIRKLTAFIDSATSSIDICMYEVFNPEVDSALIRAHSRGVKIRIITDSSYYDRDGIVQLINAGIPVINEGIGANSANHIMHNKFMIRDFQDSDTTNDVLWTGSFNASEELHVDNVITVKSHTLCRLYEKEFNQMWGSDTQTPDSDNAKTGRRKSDVLWTHGIKIGQDSVYLFFSPQDSAIQYIINLVNHARSEIRYLIFSFTRSDLKDALISAKNRGVDIKGVHENNSRDEDRLNTVFNDLKDAGISVYWAAVPSGYTFLHDKVMIIDSEYVITGSMNWTNGANDNNDENILIVKNKRLAGIYLSKFWEVYQNSIRPHIDLSQKNSPSLVCSAKNGHIFFVSKGLLNTTYPLVIYDPDGRGIKKIDNGSLLLKTLKDLPEGVYIIKGRDGQSLYRAIKLK